jgi:ATP-binding cassette, subfamily B, bacterial
MQALAVPDLSVNSPSELEPSPPRRELLTVETDINLQGETETQWLVISNEEIVVRSDAAQGGTRHVLPLSEVKSFRTWSTVGSGLLQAQTEEGWIDLLRYSNALADRFHKVARKLEVLRGEGQWTLHDDESLDATRCPKCQLRMEHAGQSCPRCMQRGQILQRVWQLMRPQLGGAILLSVLTVVGVIAELVPPKLQQYLVDQVLAQQADVVNQGGFVRALLVVVLALAASRVMLSVVGVFKGRIATTIGAGLTHQLRTQMVRRLQQLAVAYYDRHQVGSMMSRVAYDSEVLHGLMHQITGGFLLQIVQLIGVGAMLLWLNSKLALFTLIPVPLVFIGTWFFWRYVYPRYYRLWDASSKQIAALSGMLSGIRVVKAFAQQDREYDRFSKSSKHLQDSRLWVENATANYSATMQLVFSLGGLIVWYVGGRDVIGHKMSLGELIAFLAYLAMFYAPLGALSNFTTWLTSFLTGSKRVMELLDAPIAIAEPEQPKAWSQVRGEVAFENVTFGYDRHQPVINNVSFRVRPGEMIGIVGRSGSGKTTMVNLLSRFYDVQEGRITIDGIDVRDLSGETLRKHLGIVFQDSFLFRGTIFENLAYGCPDTTIEHALESAKAAGAHDFICRNPLGYETPLGEHGAGLSGGEKQRLSIARTLLYDPKILVLDEATSNIDAEAEKSIQEALEVLIHGRTTIAIAHRLSTLRNADRILVFERGRLTEEGSHAELLIKDGTYARLVKIQTQISKDPNVDRLLTHSNDPSDRGPDRSDDGSSTQASETLRVDAAHGSATDGDEATSLTTVTATPAKPTPGLLWLDPEQCRFTVSDQGQLRLQRDEQPEARSVFVVATFPASHPMRYLSVRTWNDSGDQEEIGMIADLDAWAEESQSLVRDSLHKRYLIRRISRIERIREAHGYLEFAVVTEQGPESFTLRWSHSHAQDFGINGKLLIDSEDNRYVIGDVDALPSPDRVRLQQYIYW